MDDESAGPGAPIVVEMWPIGLHRGRWWAGAATRIPLTGGDLQRHPHEHARAAAEDRGLIPAVVHSTSWRMEAASVLLTYLVVVGGDHWMNPGARIEIHSDHNHIVASDPRHSVVRLGTATQAPGGLGDALVLHHAIHHLALLATTNSAIAGALGAVMCSALAPLAPAPAGELTDRSQRAG